MLNPTQQTTSSNDEVVVLVTILEDEHASPDRSVIGPYSVEMPDPRD